MEAKSLIRPAISLTLIVLTVLGLLNVYSDNSAVLEKASTLACDDCEPRLIQEGRSPISHQYSFQTEGATIVLVECRRPAIFIGEYQCEKSSP